MEATLKSRAGVRSRGLERRSVMAEVFKGDVKRGVVWEDVV